MAALHRGQPGFPVQDDDLKDSSSARAVHERHKACFLVKLRDRDALHEMVTKDISQGGTFLRTSRTNPAKTPLDDVPSWLRDQYTEQRNDLTAEVLKNLDWLVVDHLIPIGGDDTLSYGSVLKKNNYSFF